MSDKVKVIIILLIQKATALQLFKEDKEVNLCWKVKDRNFTSYSSNFDPVSKSIFFEYKFKLHISLAHDFESNTFLPVNT